MQLERNPQYSVDQITDRLATRHGWTDAERRLHRRRLDDIQQTRAMAVLNEKALAPHGNNPVAIQAYFEGLNARAEDARLLLNDIDDLN
jgi:hypothetical protein